MREKEILYRAIETILQVYSKEIRMDSTFDLDLGADSIDLAQIFAYAEEELGISLIRTDLEKVKTVQDAYDLIMRSEEKIG